jgi:hypothetical protein|uniref:Uncharacterized protein n=1 Tax=viral metagenome TaxID=1070528 RepID=A0A6C0CVA2_9ZZZZ
MEPAYYLVGVGIGCVATVVIYVYIKLIDCIARVRITYAEI